MRHPRPRHSFPRAFQHQRGAGLGVRPPSHRQQHGGRMLYRAAQAEPGSERDAARHFDRRIAQIHRHQPESATLDQQIGRFERPLRAMAATHPKQAVEAHAGRRGGSRVEGVFGVHQRADFLARRGLGQDGNQQAGASRRSRSKDFRQAAARQPPGSAINLRNPDRNHLRRRARLPLQRPAAQHRFELFFDPRRAAHIRLLFACTIFLQDGRGGVKTRKERAVC